MHVQDLKRWHWVVIAAVVGLAMSYVWTEMEPTMPRSMGQQTFEQQLVREPHDGHPWLANLVVYPPIEGVYIVTGEELTADAGATQGTYKPFSFKAETPYLPGAWQRQRGQAPAEADPNETVLTWLEKTAAAHPHAKYRYAWEREPTTVYALCTGGAVLLIGGAWPTLVNVLVGAGLGGQRRKEPEYDLDRFGKGEDGAVQPRAAAEPTDAQREQLAAVEAELERKLAAGAGAGAGDVEGVAEVGSDVRTLDAGPLEAAPVAQDEGPKEYRGEYYPVAKPLVHAKKEPT